MRLLIAIFLFGLTRQFLLKENVLFHKVKEVTTTRSQWLITFVMDLDPFEHFLNKLALNINETFLVTGRVHTIANFYTPEKKRFLSTMLSIQAELKQLNKTKKEIFEKFQDYKSMYYDYTTTKFRTKRSLIPIVGKVLSFLFGTVSESDLSS